MLQLAERRVASCVSRRCIRSAVRPRSVDIWKSWRDFEGIGTSAAQGPDRNLSVVVRQLAVAHEVFGPSRLHERALPRPVAIHPNVGPFAAWRSAADERWPPRSAVSRDVKRFETGRPWRLGAASVSGCSRGRFNFLFAPSFFGRGDAAYGR